MRATEPASPAQTARSSVPLGGGGGATADSPLRACSQHTLRAITHHRQTRRVAVLHTDTRDALSRRCHRKAKNASHVRARESPYACRDNHACSCSRSRMLGHRPWAMLGSALAVVQLAHAFSLCPRTPFSVHVYIYIDIYWHRCLQNVVFNVFVQHVQPLLA